MNKAQTKLVAEILVEMGYATQVPEAILNKLANGKNVYLDKKIHGDKYCVIIVDITSDTLEARQQLDVMRDYMFDKQRKHWHKYAVNSPIATPIRDWEIAGCLDCLDQLTGDK